TTVIVRDGAIDEKGAAEGVRYGAAIVGVVAGEDTIHEKGLSPVVVDAPAAQGRVVIEKHAIAHFRRSPQIPESRAVGVNAVEQGLAAADGKAIEYRVIRAHDHMYRAGGIA